jgi:MFS family permease
VIRRLVFAVAAVTFVAGVMEVAIFALIDDGLHRSPAFLGVLSTAQGVGAVIGGVMAGAVLRRFGEQHTIGWSLAVAALGIGLLATADLWIVLASGIAVGLAVALFNVALITLVQRRTDVTMQGRVMSALDAAVTLPMAISLALGAGLVAIVGFRAIYVGECVALLAIAGYLVLAARGSTVETAPQTAAGSIDGS